MRVCLRPQSLSLSLAAGCAPEESGRRGARRCPASRTWRLRGEAPTLRVATWNALNWWHAFKVFDRRVPKDLRAWEPTRRVLTERYFASLDADIVCLQEINPNRFQEDFGFARALGYESVFEASRNQFMRCAVFYRREKFHAVANKTGFKYVSVRLEPVKGTACATVPAADPPSSSSPPPPPGSEVEAKPRAVPLHVVTVHLSGGFQRKAFAAHDGSQKHEKTHASV